MERLDKLLAGTGRWSRKEVKQLVRQGRVTADGAVAARPEDKYPAGAVITVDGERVRCGGYVYVLLNKPAGVLTATRDSGRTTVLDLLPDWLRRTGLSPVGRLDRDTEGLLLLTDNGPLAHRLLSPKYHVSKTYYARVDGKLGEADRAALAAGITLGDGLRCLPAELEILEDGHACRITLREGKYHQVRRMLAARNAPVTLLRRVAMGPLSLDGDLAAGQWRFLTDSERFALEAST